MRKLFVSAIALLFISQLAISAESDSDKETKATEEKVIETESEGSEKSAESEEVIKEDQKSEEVDKDKEKAKSEETDKKEDVGSEDSEKETEKASKEEKVTETTKEDEAEKKTEAASSVIDAKDSKDAALPVVESKDFLKESNSVLACMNPDALAGEVVEFEGGYVILIDVREDIVNALIEKNTDATLKLLTKPENSNPTILQMVSGMLTTAVNNINEETIEILKKLNIVKNETFKSWLEKNNLIARYSSKVTEDEKKDQSFVAIPLVYSEKDNKITIDFSMAKSIIQARLDIAFQIQELEKSVKDKVEERNEKISPDMQKNLDKLKALEAENEVLTKKLENQKNSVSSDIDQNQKAKAEAEKKKAEIEKKVKTTESNLKTEQSNLTKSQNDLNQTRNQKTTQETRLKNLNNNRTKNTELRKMKTETGNKRLNINTAKSQTQSKINTLKNKETSINKNITTNQTKIKNFQNEITKLNKEKTEAENAIKQSSEKLKTSQSSIDSIEALKTANETQIAELKNNPDTIKAMVYAGDIDKETEVMVDKSAELFRQLLTA